MTDLKISQLSDGTAPASGDLFAIARAGANYSLSWTEMQAGLDNRFIGSAASVFNVKAYGAVGDGSANDTTAILAAIAAAIAVGGIVWFPAGVYKITSTLNLTGAVTLSGAGMAQFLFNIGSPLGTRLVWGGSAGGTMINICPAAGATIPVYGAVVEGMSIEGGATNTSTGASVGVRLAAVAQCTLRNLFLKECTTATIKTEGTLDAAYLAANYATFSDYVFSCVFENLWIYNIASGGDGIYLGSTYTADNTKTVGGNDPAFCTFRHLHISYKNGNGITVADADDNAFYMIGMSGGAAIGGTGYGIRLKAAGVAGHGARDNSFFMVWPGQGGVYAEGTASGASPSFNNSIYGYSDADSPPDPVVEAGATLLWEKQSGDRYAYGGATHFIGDGLGNTNYLDAYGSTAIQLQAARRARGSLAAPRRIKSGDTIWQSVGYGFHAADDSSTAAVNTNASVRLVYGTTEDHTATAQGGYLGISTIATGGTSLVERVKVNDAGLTIDAGGSLIAPNVVLGTNAATSGAIGIPNATQFFARNAANSADVALFQLDASNFFFIQSSMKWADGAVIALGTTTGTKIGTSTLNKLGFFNATPVVQPSGSGSVTVSAAGSTNTVFRNTSFTGGLGGSAYTIGDIVAALISLGLLAA